MGLFLRRSVMIKTPRRGNGYLTLVNGLESIIWLVTFGMILIGSLFASMRYYLSRLGYYKAREKPTAEMMSFGESLYQSFVILCQQGSIIGSLICTPIAMDIAIFFSKLISHAILQVYCQKTLSHYLV